MHLVYRNAICTLAASEAETLGQSLLDAKKPTVKSPFTHPLDLVESPKDFIQGGWHGRPG